MSTVLFVDDDILTLNKLRNLVNWDERGYEIIGQAMDGIEALQMIEKYRPNIVLLDIDMPKKNGVEVTKEVYERFQEIHIIILSNYNDFEFVRLTMKYGVHDYLLKHQLTSDQLVKKLRELEALRYQRGISTLQMNYFASIAKQQYLYNLVLNGITDQKQHKLMITQKEFNSNFYILTVVQVVNFIVFKHFYKQDALERLVNSIINLSSNISSSLSNGIITYIEDGKFALLFNFESCVSYQEIADDANMYMGLLSSNIRKFLNINITYHLSDIINDLSKLNIHYRSALEISEFKQTVHINITDEKKLIDALTSLSFQKTQSLIRELFQPYIEQEISTYQVQQIIYQLFEIGKRFLKTYQVTLNSGIQRDLMDKFREPINTRKAYDTVLAYYQTLLEVIYNESYQKYSPHVQKALQYIHANYMNNISLTDTANFVNVSYAHLSRLFKKETGYSFIDYLTNYRVETAKSLMREPHSEIKGIYNKVGFQSYNYFLRVFKEKTGYTPSQAMEHNNLEFNGNF